MRVGAFAVGLSGRETHKRKGWKKGVLLIHLSWKKRVVPTVPMVYFRSIHL